MPALANLGTHGFLDWAAPLGGDRGQGGRPAVKQATNAYRLALPPAAEKLLGHLASPPPAPEDIEHATAARMAAVVAIVDGFPLDEQRAAAGLTGPLAAALSRLGRGRPSGSAEGEGAVSTRQRADVSGF